MPKPESFPKSAWYDEVKRGFEFFHQSQRKDLTPPPVQPVVDYFRSRAPANLEANPEKSVPVPDAIRFRRSEIIVDRPSSADANPAAISFVSHWPRTSKHRLLLSDMANGRIDVANLPDGPATSHRVSSLKNPAAVCRCDLNGNGNVDLVIADLGSYSPADHDKGRVIWLADVEEDPNLESGIPLVEGLGRVADVQPADFDGDQDIDLVVAEFGWHTTGRILLLRNDGPPAAPKFTLQVIDRRPGTIHVPVVDLNRDGRPDFVALISQETEAVVAFLNQGDGTFDKQTIYSAEDPSFGSSGIQVVDLDRDGDDDVLMTNGDMFDSFLIKPYHGIQWLENTGKFPFVAHHMAAMPGVHRALAGDLDKDGDLDIVVAAFLPASVRESPAGKSLDSLIWLEQSRPGVFVRHALETGNCVHAALDVADLDGDDDLDIVAGAFRDRGSAEQPIATIWWNERTSR